MAKVEKKSHKCAQCFSLSFKAGEEILKFDTTAGIIEESSVKALSLRSNPQRPYRAKHLSSSNETYSDTGFYSAQTTYLRVKVLTFVKNAILLNHC